MIMKIMGGLVFFGPFSGQNKLVIVMAVWREARLKPE